MNIEQYECTIDLISAILWEDNDAVNLQGLINAKQAWYQENHCDFWNDWITDVFDLNTANAFGLRVWAEILNIPLFTGVTPSPNSFPDWGFRDNNFGNGSFATESNSTYRLSTDQQRIVLRLRFFQLVTNCSSLQINDFLSSLFGRGVLYVIDNLDMTITYVNTLRIAPELIRTITELDLFPRPAGVKVNFVDGTLASWGFSPNSQNFGNGNLITG